MLRIVSVRVRWRGGTVGVRPRKQEAVLSHDAAAKVYAEQGFLGGCGGVFFGVACPRLPIPGLHQHGRMLAHACRSFASVALRPGLSSSRYTHGGGSGRGERQAGSRDVAHEGITGCRPPCRPLRSFATAATDAGAQVQASGMPLSQLLAACALQAPPHTQRALVARQAYSPSRQGHCTSRPCTLRPATQLPGINEAGSRAAEARGAGRAGLRRLSGLQGSREQRRRRRRPQSIRCVAQLAAMRQAIADKHGTRRHAWPSGMRGGCNPTLHATQAR
jgi:hypothetical protein